MKSADLHSGFNSENPFSLEKLGKNPSNNQVWYYEFSTYSTYPGDFLFTMKLNSDSYAVWVNHQLVDAGISGYDKTIKVDLKISDPKMKNAYTGTTDIVLIMSESSDSDKSFKLNGENPFNFSSINCEMNILC
jgi:hypothetical protein